MADRLLVDLGGDGQLTVGVWPDGGLPHTVSTEPLAWPLDDTVLEDLRWYLEEYLAAPFGVWEDRGPWVQTRLAEWGEAVFESVFGLGPARYTYQQARDRELELVFRSASPRLLALPWELMRDGSGPVALGLAGVSRALMTADLAATDEVPGGRLRVLMVISRPRGTRDVGYQMIARPLLERLHAVRSQVDLVVLRPPTLDALREALTAAVKAGEPFQVVHFDGHGVMAGSGAGGLLVFEGPAGGADLVRASVLAAALRDGQVQVAVLNACQSGAIGADLAAAVATGLLGAGCAAVVAMAYRVYAVAAAEFMVAFYERLFVGDTVTAAVTAGRRRLYMEDGRPSPKGLMPLADWLVPVHYLRREVAFPQVRTVRPTQSPSLEEMLDERRMPGKGVTGAAGSLDPVGVFVGRDDLLYELEAAARLDRVVVLHGPGGTGKTELAKGFGRWWRDTGGVDEPGWVLWHSFEPGVASFGLDGVITQAGLAAYGPGFSRLDVAERRAVVEKLLHERRLLLILDNFETLHSMPDPALATPALDELRCEELRAFLAGVAARGRSAVVITSRTAEDWLGEVRRIAVHGLSPTEAAEYAESLLELFPAAAPRREGRAFGELLEWLDGHPLSMRLILPRLDTTDPGKLLGGLRGTVPMPGNDDAEGGDRLASLDASISYSFAHLASKARRLLPAVSLFHGVTDAGILGNFSQVPGCPSRFAETTAQDWDEVLDDAARVGLLTSLSSGMYLVHPALPGYLAAWWRADQPADYDNLRDAAARTLVTAYADFGSWLDGQISAGDAGLAYSVIGLQYRTLCAMLGWALNHQLWREARAIVRPLDDYWDVRGLAEEAAAWTDRVHAATEDAADGLPALDTLAGSLWLFITGSQAIQQVRTMRLEEAERTYRRILDMLQAEPATPQQRSRIAVASHQLGRVAEERGRLEEAEDWYRKSLTIFEDLEDRPGMASSYHQLSMVTQEQGRLEEAEDWCRISLTIEEDLGNRPGMASSYFQLGVVAFLRRRLEEAEDWCRRSLTIKEDLGDRPGMATSYHQLGTVTQDQGRLEEAEDWYRRSLTIKEDLGNRPGIATSYLRLGMVARDWGRLEEAEDWYRRSLTIEEDLGNRPGMARCYYKLGMVAETRGQPRQALEWMIRSVALFSEFPHPATWAAPQYLARLTAELGIRVLEDSWLNVTGGPLPQTVRAYRPPAEEEGHP